MPSCLEGAGVVVAINIIECEYSITELHTIINVCDLRKVI